MAREPPTPLIALSACVREIGIHPFHVVGEKYITAVRAGAGGFPLMLPSLGDAAAPDEVRRKIEETAPAFLAFNGKRAAEAFLGHKVCYGRQPETVGGTIIYALPSTSGSASGFWDVGPWRDLAAALRCRWSRQREMKPHLRTYRWRRCG